MSLCSKYMGYKSLIMVLPFIFLFSCKPDVQRPETENKAQKYIDEALIESNKFIVRHVQDHISNFVRRRNWEMNETESGLWLGFMQEREGKLPEEGDIITYLVNKYLINGTLIDSTNQYFPLKYQLGSGRIETGLNEAFYLIPEKSVARVILPPYLAYGNTGEIENNIPRGAILVFEISVIDIQSKVDE